MLAIGATVVWVEARPLDEVDAAALSVKAPELALTQENITTKKY